MDFLSANEANLEGVPDADVLAIAAEQDRLVTHDRQTMPRHFGAFLMSGRFEPWSIFGKSAGLHRRGYRSTRADLGGL